MLCICAGGALTGGVTQDSTTHQTPHWSLLLVIQCSERVRVLWNRLFKKYRNNILKAAQVPNYVPKAHPFNAK